MTQIISEPLMNVSQVHCKGWGQRSRLSYLSHKMGIIENMGRGHQGSHTPVFPEGCHG